MFKYIFVNVGRKYIFLVQNYGLNNKIINSNFKLELVPKIKSMLRWKTFKYVKIKSTYLKSMFVNLKTLNQIFIFDYC